MTLRKLGMDLLVQMAILVGVVLSIVPVLFLVFAISGLFGLDLTFEIIGRVFGLSAEDIEALGKFAWLCGIIVLLAFVFDFLLKVFGRRRGRS